MYTELCSDLLFCILYIYDLQFAVSNNGASDFVAFVDNSRLPPYIDRFIWINRQRPTFYIGVAFAIFNLLSLSFRVGFSDSKLFTIFSFMTFIDLLTSVPFVVAWTVKDGYFLYIPFFLRAIVVVDRLKTVLRSRGVTKILRLIFTLFIYT